MKISIGNDHAGTKYKEYIIKLLEEEGHTIINNGTNGEESVDYPDHIHPVAKQVSQKESFYWYNNLWKRKRGKHDS